MRSEAKFYSPSTSKFPVTVITGTCRSGKTLLGNILATCPSVEYADEPWTAMLLPMAAKTGKIERALVNGWLGAFVSELFNDLVLMRQANFRPNDLSSIWTKKTPSEILQRLIGLSSRVDVSRFAKLNNLSLVMTLSECGSFVDVIKESILNAQFIHVVRNGFHVGFDVAEKRWLSDEQLKHPLNAQLYVQFEHQQTTFYLPWWVDIGDESYFLQLTEYERALYYWLSLIGKTPSGQGETTMHVVRYSELVSTPRVVLDRIFKEFKLFDGPMTESEIAQISLRSQPGPNVGIDQGLVERVDQINKTMGL
jgi:hypothetical protein